MEIGDPAALPLRPCLRHLLTDQRAAMAAAQALWRLDHADTGLVEPLVTIVATDKRDREAALALLTEMDAIQALPALRELATGDIRTVAGPLVHVNSIVTDDEALLSALHETIAALAGSPTPPTAPA